MRTIKDEPQLGRSINEAVKDYDYEANTKARIWCPRGNSAPPVIFRRAAAMRFDDCDERNDVDVDGNIEDPNFATKANGKRHTRSTKRLPNGLPLQDNTTEIAGCASTVINMKRRSRRPAFQRARSSVAFTAGGLDGRYAEVVDSKNGQGKIIAREPVSVMNEYKEAELPAEYYERAEKNKDKFFKNHRSDR